MFSVNSYMKVWRKQTKESKNGKEIVSVQVSSSRKNANGNGYVTDFSGYCSLFGEAAKKADQITEDCTIKILSCGVSTYYDKSKRLNYTNYVIFDFEIATSDNESLMDGELPF